MQEKEIWKLIQSWIAIKDKKQQSSFLEHIASLNEQNEKLRVQDLELYYKEEEKRSIQSFFVITPYLIQMYEGWVIEKEGTIQIEQYEMVKQISCDSVKLPNIIGRTVDCENPFDAIAPFVKENAYILNGMNGSIQYYQEKDEDGLYGRILETEDYIKIGRPRKKAVQTKEVITIPHTDLTSFDSITLVENGFSIVPILKKQSETCMIAIDICGLQKEVGKVYQLL